MQATGAGPRALAPGLNLAQLRVALLGVCLCAAITLPGCETLPRDAPDAATTPEEITGLELRAEQAYQDGDWLAAENGYRRMVVLAPENAEHWFRLANTYAHMNMFGEAVRMYGEALKRDSGHLDAWHNLGMAQMQLAARSFVQLQARAPADDPVRERARRLVEGVTGVLESEQTGAGASLP